MVTDARRTSDSHSYFHSYTSWFRFVERVGKLYVCEGFDVASGSYRIGLGSDSSSPLRKLSSTEVELVELNAEAP